jgi:hypothetical protein
MVENVRGARFCRGRYSGDPCYPQHSTLVHISSVATTPAQLVLYSFDSVSSASSDTSCAFQPIWNHKRDGSFELLHSSPGLPLPTRSFAFLIRQIPGPIGLYHYEPELVVHANCGRRAIILSPAPTGQSQTLGSCRPAPLERHH